MRTLVRFWLPAVLLLVVGPGCSRKFFRERTDKDVAGVITQKNHFPAWAVKNWYVYPHPDSRFADPYNPDHPPYPPDDYATRLLSPNPQHPTKKAGTGRFEGDGYMRLLAEWDAQNRAAEGVAAKDARAAAPGEPQRIYYPRPPYMNHGKAAKPAAVATEPRGQGASPRSNPVPAATEPGKKDKWTTVKPVVSISTDENDPNVIPAGPAIIEHRTAPVVPAIPAPDDLSKPTPATGTMPIAPSTPQPPIALPDLPTNPSPTTLPQPEPLPKSPTDPPVIPVPRAPEQLPIIPKPVENTPPGEFPSVEELSTVGSTDADYLRALETNEYGYLLTSEQALQLGLINSREFQDRREDLYLAALPVTLERYNFAAQAFFAEQVIRDFTGSRLSDAGRLWSLDTETGFTKNFATGASLLVRLANQVVIDLGSDRPDIAFSNFGISLFQPFLRGGELAVNLEGLTSAERNMVYAMRSYARFRKLYYVAITAGGGITNNPYGLQGLSVNLGRGIGGNLTAPSVGYLPLLQQTAGIANQQKNVEFLEQLLQLYKAFREGGQQSDLQVGQVEVDLLDGRGRLLQVVQGYLDNLDNFKLQLGIPMTVGLSLNDTPLEPIREQLARFEDLYADLRALEDAARAFDLQNPAVPFRDHWRRLLTESDLVKGTEFAKGITERLDALAKLSPEQLNARTQELLKRRRELYDPATGVQPTTPAAQAELTRVSADLDLAAFERALRLYESEPWKKPPMVGVPATQERAFGVVLDAFSLVALAAKVEREGITRQEWPELPSLPVNGVNLLTANLDEAYTVGIQAALSSRLDLMNARGQVVDAYRRIAIQANSLQGVFDVEYDYSTSTPAGGSRPFAFSPERSRHTLTITGELPLVRRAERNNYRASLISYQRQRRTLMSFEDNIANDVRSRIRQLRTTAQLYKIQQRTIELGYSQVDNAQALLLEPPAPGATASAGNAAALTEQVLRNQRNLLTAQNELFQLYVNYLTARMQLYLDLELMQLDDRGVWCDEQSNGTDDPPRPGSESQPNERLPAPRPIGPVDGQ